MTKDYYSINKILNIIKNYHINIKNMKELQIEARSVGVSQYGIDSSMPKGNTISSVVENEVLRQMENVKFWADMATDIKYVQERLHKITDEQEAKVLHLRLDGCSVVEIAKLLGIERAHVYRLLKNIAKTIKSYPQEERTNETNDTNFAISK